MNRAARRITLLSTLLVAGTFAGCRGGAPPAPRALAPITIEARLWRADDGGIPDSTEVVIRDAAAMRDLWTRATSMQATPPELEDIDFRRQMVVMVAAGRMAPADEIRIDSVGVRIEPTAGGGRQEVLAVQYTITENCGRFAGDAYPVEIVRVSRYDGQVRFLGRRQRSESCR